MLQRGRGEQQIKYKEEVLKVLPNAKWESRFIPGQANGLNKTYGAIWNGNKRISEVERIAWKAWESAYYKLLPTSLGVSAEEISDDAHEKEIMMQAFAKINDLFQARTWIIEGRGSYPYNDDRYKEEVRYLFDEFDEIYKDTWKNIKSKSFEYRNKIIAKHESDASSLLKEKEDEIREYKDDLKEAAGELLIEIPHPHSDMAKVISANSILRQQKAQLQSELSKYKALAEEGIQRLTDLYMETTDLERNKKQMERPFIIGTKEFLDNSLPQPPTTLH